jgi:UPF0755 protein
VPDRSPEEREAARLERERRRAGQQGQPPQQAAPRQAAPRQAAPRQAAPRQGAPVTPPPVAPPPVAPPPQPAPSAVAADDHDGYEDDYETGEHEVEMPSGTRRVSHLETLTARRERAAPGKASSQPQRRARKPPRAARKGRRIWFVRVGALLALIVAGAAIWFLIELFQPFHGSGHGEVTVQIPERATSKQIGDLLAKDGVINSSLFFELRATLAGDRSDLRSGVYHLRLGMTYSAVLSKLTTAPPAARTSELTLTPGRTRRSIDALLRGQHIKGSYLAATRHSPLINYRAYGLHRPPVTLEGFLFPDTYQLLYPVKISDLVKDQLTAFRQSFAKINFNYARSKHLTPYDVLTIASLVEAEAATARDRPLVASVIYNRLADGMMLQFDSTTRYATGNYTRPLTVSELHSRSPWNTHTHLGLPPTPIDNPSLAAIQAAAHPARSNYLFFFTRPCAKGAVYASTYSQFLAQGSQNPGKACKK